MTISRRLVDVRISEEGSTLVVSVQGELDLAAAPELADELKTVELGRFDKVVFDLLQVGFMDSSGLGALIALRSEHPDTEVALVAKDDGLVSKVLRLTSMEELFPIFPTREAALS